MLEPKGKIEPSVEIKAEIIGTGPRGPSGANGKDGRDGKDGKDATPYDDSELRGDITELKRDIYVLEKEVMGYEQEFHAKYYKIQFDECWRALNSSASLSAAVAEVSLIGADGLQKTIVSAKASSEYDTAYAASKAIDGSFTTFWSSKDILGYPHTLTLELDEAAFISRIGMIPRADVTTSVPNNMTIFASINGDEWVEIAKFTDKKDGWTAKTWRYFDLSLINIKVQSLVKELKNDISAHEPLYPGVDLSVKFAEEISGYSDPGAWIRARIRANNFDGIHVNDYIPFTTTNGLKFKARVAGIDPYYEYGDSAIGHHIDFICEELWPTLHPINPVNYNNGLIPTENVTSDGSSVQYVLTKPMYGVAKVTLSGTGLTGWTYDKDTYTLTFYTAPAAGTMVVTGTGSEYQWLASDAYLYVNSLAGHVANGTGLNPDIKRVDYTNDGIYHYLPDWLKAAIIEKRFLLNKRYSATGILSDENSWGWTNIGKIWFPTEVEVYGCPVWGSKGGYGLGGSIQYPYFVGNMRRLKKRNGGRDYWWLLSPNTGAADWCYVTSSGVANRVSASGTYVAAPVCFRIG